MFAFNYKRTMLKFKNVSFMQRLLTGSAKNVSTKSVRVRFAPSPTGNLHLGGLRTALYNYLFALSKDGSMILRIEDTDQKRVVDGAIESLIKNLEWAGIYCHEGPTQGGKYGPYIQSERCDIYKNEVQNLIDKGSAYRCFCTDQRLHLLRRNALRNQQVPKYDNRCRSLSDDEVKTKLNRGEKCCIRFKLSSDCRTFDDLIYGSIAYDVSLNEGDPVILKADGFPTYHLANVVDDHLMEISHVLRGVEWQISTTKHLLMYKAFGWEPPLFGHLPLIVNNDGSKLSKRQGDIKIDDYQNKGIFPIALINFITLSGGGFPHIPGEGPRHNSIKELANEFQLERVNTNSSRLNIDLLNECNRLTIMEALKNDCHTEKLVSQIQEMVKEKYEGKNVNTCEDYIKSILKWSSGRISYLSELVSPSFLYLWILPDQTNTLNSSSKSLIQALLNKLNAENEISFEKSSLHTLLKDFSNENNIKFNDLMKLLRNILCGSVEGPKIVEIMEILGKDISLKRLKNSLNLS